MGAKTWMLVIADSDVQAQLAKGQIDRAETARVASVLFPKEKLTPLADGSLISTCPPRKELCIGCFPGVEIIAADEFAIDYPSKLATHFLRHAGPRTVYLHAMHSVVDWFAFAVWQNGQLMRSLSVAPDSGVIEDIGNRMDFELPYWDGKHPAAQAEGEDKTTPYPLPFHPLDLGEAALRCLFGYQLEGDVEATPLDADNTPLLRFKRKKPLLSWW